MHFRCARRQERADALHADEKCWAAQAVCGRATGPLFDHWFREFNIVQTPAIRPRCSTPPRLLISILLFIIPTSHCWLSKEHPRRHTGELYSRAQKIQQAATIPSFFTSQSRAPRLIATLLGPEEEANTVSAWAPPFAPCCRKLVGKC